MAFQIIGIDVMLDHQLRPFLLETNNGPSFNMDADIDRDIKLQVGRGHWRVAFAFFLLLPPACTVFASAPGIVSPVQTCLGFTP